MTVYPLADWRKDDISEKKGFIFPISRVIIGEVKY